MINIMGRLVS